METYIYIDQNILSDLRERKLNESGDAELRMLKDLCKNNGVRLIYSDTHLQEINQIPKEEYRLEHIELLSELHASYITPITRELNAKDAHLVWRDFLDNDSDNESLGINKVVTLNDKIHRKYSGLPIEESFKELNEQLKGALTDMLKSAEQELENFDPNELQSGGVEAIKVARAQMTEQLEAVAKMVSFEVENEQELGPKPLRDLGRLKALDLHNQSESEVINLIDELFAYENEGFNWSDYFDDTVHNQIARCYSLMNWVGYFADDFTKIKKNKDRFRASSNDLMHVRNAAGSTMLFSRDHAFLKKAKACYLHLKVRTIVANPDEIQNYL